MSRPTRWARPAWWPDLRPLDPVRSIKAKLALLVGASATATALITWYGLVILGWYPRYTLPVAVLISLGVTQVLARGMTQPLRQMTAAAKQLAAGGPRPQVSTTSRDEVGELARAFTAMADDLATVDAQRRELLANVGHELRTPLAALRAQLENLVDGVREPDPDALGDLLVEVGRLGDLVSDLLDLARADAGVAPLHRVPVDVAGLAAEVADQVRAVRPDRRVVVQIASGLRADADPLRLRQVLVNLLDNASRHAPPGGLVEVVGRPGPDGAAVIEVADDGPGIPPEQHDAVFRRFHRGPLPDSGDGPAADRDGGTGLGLAIARWAVALHGGRIGVVPPTAADSAGGCRIRVEIPRSARE